MKPSLFFFFHCFPIPFFVLCYFDVVIFADSSQSSVNQLIAEKLHTHEGDALSLSLYIFLSLFSSNGFVFIAFFSVSAFVAKTRQSGYFA